MRLVKRYPNRKLYDHQNSMWISQKDLFQEVAQGADIKVVDRHTNEDITFRTLVGCMWSSKLNKGSTEALVELIRKSYE